MARYPHAAWHPSPNHGGSLARSLGLILHVEQGSEPGTVGWFCNPTSQASSHFGVGKDGHVDQFVDTDLRSWAQVAGNADYWSVETEGFATDLLTDPQVQAIADLYRWLQHLPTAQFDYQLAETPGQAGFGWHGMGGAAVGRPRRLSGPTTQSAAGPDPRPRQPARRPHSEGGCHGPVQPTARPHRRLGQQPRRPRRLGHSAPTAACTPSAAPPTPAPPPASPTSPGGSAPN